MDSEKIEQFVLTYCTEHKLKYSQKNRIYTITLNAAHQKWFGEKELNITFDQNLPKSKKIHLIDATSSILHTLTANYITRTTVTSLIFPKTKHQLLDANEKLLELPKKGIKYHLEVVSTTAQYLFTELTVIGSNGAKTTLIPILHIQKSNLLQTNITTCAKNIDLDHTIQGKDTINCQTQINEIILNIPTSCKKELDVIEEQHQEKVTELASITQDNSIDKYTELQQKEDAIINKIEELKEKSVRASNFDTRRNCDDKIRELKKKHQELVEKNKTIRESIKKEFDKEQTEITKRDLIGEMVIQAYATIEMPMIIANFEDNDQWVYLPILNQFIHIQK